MQYLVKFAMEYKHAIPGQIYQGIQACNNLLKFAKEYKHAIPGQIS